MVCNIAFEISEKAVGWSAIPRKALEKLATGHWNI